MPACWSSWSCPRSSRRLLGDQPFAGAHQVAAGELVGLAPGLDAAGPDPEVQVAGRLAGVEAGLGGERVADLGRDLGGWRHLIQDAFDEDDVAGRADADPDLAVGLEVPAGRAGGRGG